ncbi:MAG: acyloxyacyl hydrolase [Methylococcales bacterium]|jgi:lipid A 3-O-deacylase|nr:acyloxyacyl hydrolase [Methylococcales bacterium]MBT7445483.1 acyloxyacyl hydrolase [Methylococcales bacterium]
MKTTIKNTLLPVLISTLAATSAFAESRDSTGFIHEFKFGVLQHDVDNLWSGFEREDGLDVNLEVILKPYVDFLGGQVRPAVGGSFNNAGDTSKIYVDARWEKALSANAYFSLGLGAAVHDEDRETAERDRKELGSQILFHFPIELGYRFDKHHGLSVYFDHISNAYLISPNEGMDSLGVRYGYTF